MIDLTEVSTSGRTYIFRSGGFSVGSDRTLFFVYVSRVWMLINLDTGSTRNLNSN